MHFTNEAEGIVAAHQMAGVEVFTNPRADALMSLGTYNMLGQGLYRDGSLIPHSNPLMQLLLASSSSQ